MQQSLKNWAIVIFVLVVLAAVALTLTRREAFTKEQMESRVQLLLKENISVPIPDDTRWPTVNVTPRKGANGGWDFVIETTNFLMVGEQGDPSLATGYAYIFIDGKPSAAVADRTYHVDSLSNGRHVILVGLQNPDFYLYRHKGKLVTKIIDGTYTDEGYTPISQ